jgi:hypothetical protein
MTTTFSDRRVGLNTTVLLLVVFAAIQVTSHVHEIEHNTLYQSLVLVTSKGLFDALIWAVYFAIRNSQTLLRLYWGKYYLQGLWSYEYYLGDARFVGIWRIDQDLDNARVVGSGLDANFRVRTIVRSISPLIEETNAYFVINDRTELTTNSHVYSKTTLIVDRPPTRFGEPVTMRATTEVFGGPSSGQVHPNVIFTRQRDAETEQEVIAVLRALPGPPPQPAAGAPA